MRHATFYPRPSELISESIGAIEVRNIRKALSEIKCPICETTMLPESVEAVESPDGEWEVQHGYMSAYQLVKSIKSRFEFSCPVCGSRFQTTATEVFNEGTIIKER